MRRAKRAAQADTLLRSRRSTTQNSPSAPTDIAWSKERAQRPHGGPVLFVVDNDGAG